MVAKTHEKLIEEIGNMSVLELSELVKALEEKFGVTAAMPAAGPAVGAAAAPQAVETAEKAEYEVTLKSVGSEKIKVIKLVKQYSGLGLSEAKAAVEGAPTVIAESASKEDAQKMKEAIEAAGAKVKLS